MSGLNNLTPESQGQNLAVAVLHVPYSLVSGMRRECVQPPLARPPSVRLLRGQEFRICLYLFLVHSSYAENRVIHKLYQP